MNSELPDNKKTVEVAVADSAPWSEWTRRVIGIFSIIFIIVGLSVAGPIYGQVVIAAAVCLFLFTPIRYLMLKAHLSYTAATLVIFSIYVIALLLLILFLSAPVARFVGDLVAGIDDFTSNLLVYLENYQRGQALLYDQSGQAIMDLDFIFGPLSDIVTGRDPQEFTNLAPTIASLLGSALGFAGTLAGLAYNLFFISVFALLFLLELPRLYQWMINHLSLGSRRQYGIVLSRFDNNWTGYLWGTAVVASIGAVSTWFLMTVLGIPNAVGIAATTTIVLLIPIFGPILGTIVCFIAALIGGSTVLNLDPLTTAIVAAFLFFLMRGFVIGNFIYPRIVGKSIDIPAVAIMIGLSFFGSIGGILGMLLSPVLLALLRDIAVLVLQKLDGKEPFPDEPLPEFMQYNVLKNFQSETPEIHT